MSNAEILDLIRELTECGIHITPRDERHTAAGAAKLQELLNRCLRHIGRKCEVTLDAVGMVVVLVPADE